MKTSIFALLFLASTVASAVDFEAAIGHSSGMSNAAYSLGLTGLVTDNLRWRAGFASLGKPSYNHLVSQAAAQDDIQAGEGPGPYYWQAQPNYRNIYLTLAPEIHRGDWVFSVEGGLMAMRQTFQQDVQIGQPSDYSHPNIRLSSVFGISAGYQKTSLVLQFHHFTQYGEWDSGDNMQHGIITTLFLRRIF